MFELDTKTIDILDSALSYLVFFDDGLGIGVTVYAGVWLEFNESQDGPLEAVDKLPFGTSTLRIYIIDK